MAAGAERYVSGASPRPMGNWPTATLPLPRSETKHREVFPGMVLEEDFDGHPHLDVVGVDSNQRAADQRPLLGLDHDLCVGDIFGKAVVEDVVDRVPRKHRAASAGLLPLHVAK